MARRGAESRRTQVYAYQRGLPLASRWSQVAHLLHYLGHRQAWIEAQFGGRGVGLATIYVVPAEGATSQFFKLEAK